MFSFISLCVVFLHTQQLPIVSYSDLKAIYGRGSHLCTFFPMICDIMYRFLLCHYDKILLLLLLLLLQLQVGATVVVVLVLVFILDLTNERAIFRSFDGFMIFAIFFWTVGLMAFCYVHFVWVEPSRSLLLGLQQVKLGTSHTFQEKC